MIIGIALGVLIAFVSLVPFTIFVKIGHRLTQDEDVSMGNIGKVVTLLLSLPTFWFGGPWVSTKMIATLDWQDLTEPYIIALASTFVLSAGVLVVLLIAQTAREIAPASKSSSDRGRP